MVTGRKSNTTNLFRTTLTSAVSPSATSFPVASLAGAPSSPCWVFIRSVAGDQWEIIDMDGTYGASTFVCSSTDKRYQSGSSAASGLTHAAGSIVEVRTVAQLFDEIHELFGTDLDTELSTYGKASVAEVVGSLNATYVTVNEGPNPITKYDAVADADGAATDNRTAILSAISDVSAIGGGEVSFVSADGGRFGFTGEIEFPAGVSPVGQAGGQNINRSHLVAQDATAKLKFVGRGGVARNLSLDGAGVSPTMLMLDATCVSRQFERIHVEDCASGDAAVRIEESQNCVFVLLDVVNCGGDGIRLDKGAGGHTFISPHTSRCGGWALNFTDSTLAGPYGDTGPSDNEFYNPIFERLDDATVDGVVRHYAGKNNVMYGPVLSGSGAAATRYLVDMGLDAGVSASSLVLVNPQLSGEGTVTHVHGARVVSGTQLAVMGHVNATALVSVLALTAGTVNWLATYNAGSVTAFKSGAGSEANIVRARTRAANEVTRAASTDPVLLGLVDGDTSARVTLRADGQMQYGPGNASADVTFGRLAAGVMGTGASYCLRTGRAATGARPSASTMGEGSQFFDTTLNKPIWSDGTDWRDAAGTVV